MTDEQEALREEIARALGRHYGDESNWVAWEAEANAQAIAALPTLIDALDEAYGELLGDGVRDGPRCLLLTKIEAALRKAGGPQ